MKANRSSSSFIIVIGATLFLGGFSLWTYGIILACQLLNVTWVAMLYVLVPLAVVSVAVVFGQQRKKKAPSVSGEGVDVQEVSAGMTESAQ